MTDQSLGVQAELKHLGGVLFADFFRGGLAPNASPEVAALRDLRLRRGGQAVLQQEAAQAQPEKVVDLPILFKVKDLLETANDPNNPLDQRKARVEFSLNLMKKIYEGQLTMATATPQELDYLASIVALSDQIMDALVLSFGLPKTALRAAILTPGNQLREAVLGSLLASEGFKKSVEETLKNLSNKANEQGDNIAQLVSEIAQYDVEINALETEKRVYDDPTGRTIGIKQWYEGKSPTALAEFETKKKLYEQIKQTLNSNDLPAFLKRPGGLSQRDCDSYRSQLEAHANNFLSLLKGIKNVAGIDFPDNFQDLIKYPGDFESDIEEKTKDSSTSNEERNKLKTLKSSLKQIKAIKAAYEATLLLDSPSSSGGSRTGILNETSPLGGGFLDDLDKYDKYHEYINEKQNEFQKKERELAKKKQQIDSLRNKINPVANAIEVGLKTAFRTFLYEDLIKNAQQLASWEQQQKTEQTTKEANETETRKTKAQELLNRYFTTAFLRYDGDKVVGFNDDLIREFAKEDLFTLTPAQLMRKLLRQIYRDRSFYNRGAKEEIEKIAEAMGIDITGMDPNRSVDQILAKIDDDSLKNMAVTFVPKLLGLARARKYFRGDILKLNVAQAEHLRSVYGEEFFTTVINQSKQFKDAFDSYFKQGVMSIPQEIGRFIKDKLIGGDWVGFLKRLLILIAIVGSGPLIGSGAGLGGGLVGFLAGLGNLGLALGAKGITEAEKIGGQLGNLATAVRP